MEELSRTNCAEARNGRNEAPADFQEVRRIARAEFEAEARKNNVVLDCIPEVDGEDVSRIVKELLPDIAGEVLSAERLGRPVTVHAPEGASQSSARASRPRKILLKMTSSGKRAVWERRRQLTRGGQPVYVNHDLTRSEQSARRSAIPAYKQLWAAGVRCSIPRSEILDQEGQPMSQARIAELLSSAA